MKIFYRTEADIRIIKKYLVKNNLESSPLEKAISLEECKESLKNYKGPAIGGGEGYLFDIGNSLYTFLLSDEFRIMVAKQTVVQTTLHGLIIPLYKKVFTVKNKTKKHNQLTIVTDDEGNGSCYAITFTLESGLNDEQLIHALSTIYEVRKRLLRLLEVVNFSGSGLIEITYVENKWSIQRFERWFSSNNTSKNTIELIEKAFPEPQNKKNIYRFFNLFRFRFK